MRRATLFLVLCISSLPLAAPATASEPVDHGPLIKALAKGATRAQAIRDLQRMGVPAVRAVLATEAKANPALERGLRAFLASLDWSRPPLRPVVDRELAKLTSNLGQEAAFFTSGQRGRHILERGRAMRSLLRMGPGVRERLAIALGGGTRLEGVLDAPVAIEQGQTVHAVARITNPGTAHVWIRGYASGIAHTAQRWHRPLLTVRGTAPDEDFSIGGGMMLRAFCEVRRRRVYDPLCGYGALPSGASLLRTQRTLKATALGTITLRWRSTNGGPLIKSPSGRQTGLALGLPAPLSLERVIHVTPQLRPAARPSAGLSLSARAGDGIAGVRIQLRNVGAQPTLVAAPAMPQAPLWWVAIDANGIPARWHIPGARQTQLEAKHLTTLAPGAALTHPVSLEGLAPGHYRVVVGYGQVCAQQLTPEDGNVWTSALESNMVRVHVRRR